MYIYKNSYLQNEYNFVYKFIFSLVLLVLFVRFSVFNYHFMTGYYANNTNMTNNVTE